MKYHVEKIIGDVLRQIGRRATPAACQGYQAASTIEERLRAQIEPCVAKAHMEAPFHALEGLRPIVPDVAWHDACAPGSHSGTVMLPADFLRLGAFQMSDWRMPVYHALAPDDSAYQLQRSRWAGVRGNPERPVCAVVPRPSGLTLEFYSCRSPDAHVAQASYLPMPRISPDGDIDISRQCYHQVLDALAAVATQPIN